MIKRGVLILLLLAGAFWGGWLSRGSTPPVTPSDHARKLDIGGGRAPLWAMPQLRCRASTEAEQQQDRLALQVLELFNADPLNRMRRGAIEHFGSPWQRSRSSLADHGVFPCPPTELYGMLTAIALKAGVFDSPFLFEDELRLAEQLGPRDPRIIDAVGRSAFLRHDIPDDPSHADLRPYARLILAEFGAASHAWLTQAETQMSADDQMGTGAAQVAVAEGGPEALARARDLLTEVLTATPKEKPLPILQRNRAYELAFALGMAGTDAQPYSAPIIELMNRKVLLAAPPFGLLELPPMSMCVVARHIGGSAAEAAQSKEFCRADETRLKH
jgi:hypothetical protein